MGKGFNNYMCKKFFHPASRDNLKRVWIAQQKDDAYRKKQEELRMQYEKEQDLYNNKALLSKESKDKLSVNFMYEPPPGAKKEREKEDNEPEYKFEWQRKYNAPREDYCKGDSEIQDQPFGILVRNVRCIKCRKWGHINTDKECPLYNQATVSQIATEKSDAISLLRQMKEDGLKLKKSALEAQQHIDVPCVTDTMPEPPSSDDDKIAKSEVNFLKGLSTKKKIKLLKQLEKLEKLEKSKKKLKKKNRRKEDDSSEESESDVDHPKKRGKTDKHRDKERKKKKKLLQEEESEEEKHHRKHRKRKHSEKEFEGHKGKKKA